MAAAARDYAQGPTRIQFMRKDPRGWREFAEALAGHSGPGAAGTQRGIMARRPTVYSLKDRLSRIATGPHGGGHHGAAGKGTRRFEKRWEWQVAAQDGRARQFYSLTPKPVVGGSNPSAPARSVDRFT